MLNKVVLILDNPYANEMSFPAVSLFARSGNIARGPYIDHSSGRSSVWPVCMQNVPPR